MQSNQVNPEPNVLKNEITEMNSNMLLFVNPYEVNPGNSRLQHNVNMSTTSSKQVKMEMEQFSNLGELIPSLKGKCVMDEFDLQRVEAEKINDSTLQSYESRSLKDIVDTQDSHNCEYHQIYIDNQDINLKDINEDDLHVLQKKLNSDCANSDLNVHSNDKLIKSTNSVNIHQSPNILQFEVNRTSHCCTDHPYANVSSPSYHSFTPESTAMEFANSTIYEKNKVQLRHNNAEFKFGMKLFIEDTLNTPDILESVVSLEDDRFDFLSCLNNRKLQTINEVDLTYEPILLSQINEESLILTSEICTKQSRKRNQCDTDEDYVPPTTMRTRKMTIKVETDTESEEESFKNRSRRISSLSSDSSKDSYGISKYRELRDKNNESSRKSRLKRRIKEQEMETEAQELEDRNFKLKTEVEELQRVVDNFRANLFQIMMKK